MCTIGSRLDSGFLSRIIWVFKKKCTKSWDATDTDIWAVFWEDPGVGEERNNDNPHFSGRSLSLHHKLRFNPFPHDKIWTRPN